MATKTPPNFTVAVVRNRIIETEFSQPADYLTEEEYRRTGRGGGCVVPGASAASIMEGLRRDAEEQRLAAEAVERERLEKEERDNALLSILNMLRPKKKPKTAQARNQSYKDYLNAILLNVMEAVRCAHNEKGKPFAINDTPFTIAQITRLLFSLGLFDSSDNEDSMRQAVSSALEAMGYVFKERGGRPGGSDKERGDYENWLHAQVRNRLGADEITKLKGLRA